MCFSVKLNKHKFITKTHKKVEYLNSYLLHESNHAFRAFRSTPDLQFPIPDPRGKIVQTVKVLPVSQNNDLTPKLYFTRQH